jgi:hypothetical protein
MPLLSNLSLCKKFVPRFLFCSCCVSFWSLFSVAPEEGTSMKETCACCTGEFL